MVKNYFMEKSFDDAKETVKGAFRRNGEVIAQYRDKMKESKREAAFQNTVEGQNLCQEQDVAGGREPFENLNAQDVAGNQESLKGSDAQSGGNQVKVLFNGITIAAVAVVGTVSVLCCAGFHYLILGLIALGLYIVMGFLRLVDMIQKAVGSKQCCSGCGTLIQDSICLCPKCGELHKNLVSSEYGVLHKTCSCGERLPVSSLNGRSSLTRVCPGCGMIIPPKKMPLEENAQMEG